MGKTYPIAEITKELEKAKNYKIIGEKSRSRVSARLAAGKAIRYWLISSHSIIIAQISPFQALELSIKLPDIPENIRESLNNLTKKVNYDYSFPGEIDLINDSSLIIDFVSNKVANDRSE